MLGEPSVVGDEGEIVDAPPTTETLRDADADDVEPEIDSELLSRFQLPAPAPAPCGRCEPELIGDAVAGECECAAAELQSFPLFPLFPEPECVEYDECCR